MSAVQHSDGFDRVLFERDGSRRRGDGGIDEKRRRRRRLLSECNELKIFMTTGEITSVYF